MEGDRRDLVQLPLFGLVGVQVVLALARAVDGRRHVERRGGLAFAVFLDGQDGAVGRRQTTEEPRRGCVRPVGLLAGERDDVVRVIGPVGWILGQGGDERMAVGVPLTAGDLVLLGLDPLEVLHPEGMDLFRGGVHRRLHPNCKPIRVVAAGRVTKARRGSGVRGVGLGQVVAQTLQGGIDVLHHRAPNGLAAGLVGHVGQDDSRGDVGRNGQHPVDLLDRLLDRDRGRGSTVRDPLVQGADLLFDERRERGKAGQHPVEALGRVRALVLGDLRRPGLGPGHVVDGQLVQLAVLRLEVVSGDEDQEVAGDDRFDVERVGVDRLRLGERGGQGAPLGSSAVRTEVGPALVIPVVAVDGGGDRVALEDALPETIGEVSNGSVGVVVMGHEAQSPWGCRNGVVRLTG